MIQAREAAYSAHDAASETTGSAREAARAAGHAVATAHMADHELAAAAYAIKAVLSVTPEDARDKEGKNECEWQRNQLPKDIYDLVVSDQQNRNKKFWSLFDY